MKNTPHTQSRSTGRLHAAFSVCRHGLLVLSSLAALSAQAGQPNETVFIGGTSALSTLNFGNDAEVPTPLTSTTVITGTVFPSSNVDQIALTLPAGAEITGASVAVTNYTAPQGSLLNGLIVRISQGMSSASKSLSADTLGSSFESLPELGTGGFSVSISAPTSEPNEGQTNNGSASYVITLTISSPTVPVAELAGSYIGLVQSNSLIRGRIAQIVSETPVKPIPNEALNARLDMTVTANGTVTGKLVYGPTQVAFSSIFATSTVNSVLVAPPKLVIPIPAYNRSLVLNFGTDDEDEGYIDGALVQQGSESEPNKGNVFGWKNTWTAVKSPTLAVTSYKTFTMNGIFRTNGEGGAPRGTSFGSVKAEAAVGTYLAAGTLADGQKFTSTGFYGPSGDFLIYQYLYASLGKGSFSGSASVNSNQAVPANVQEANSEVQVPTISGGGFTWIKNPSPATTSAAPGRPKKFGRPVPIAGPSDTLYPEGFQSSGFIRGTTYTPPAAGQVLNVTGERNVFVNTNTTNTNTTNISFNNYQRSGAVSFGGTVAITSLGAASRANSITVIPGSFSGTAASNLTFQFDAATGLYKGSFKVTPPLRTINFEGIFVYNPVGRNYTGAGYFISNRFEISATSPVMSRQRVSGSVSIGYNGNNTDF